MSSKQIAKALRFQLLAKLRDVAVVAISDGFIGDALAGRCAILR
jgi:hypothetical protein